MKRFLVALAAAAVCLPMTVSAAHGSIDGQYPTPTAGYIFYTPEEGMTDFTTAWRVPDVRCTTPNSSVTIYASIGYAWVGVDVDCAHGVPRYKAWHKFTKAHRTNLPNPVTPGDAIRVRVSLVGTGTHVRLADPTADWNWETDLGRQAPLGGALHVGQRRSPEHLRALADFSTLQFAATFWNGRPYHSFVYRHRLESFHHHITKATTTKFDKALGQGTITWVRK